MASFKTCMFALLAAAVVASPAFAHQRYSPARHFVQRPVYIVREAAPIRTAAGETFAWSRANAAPIVRPWFRPQNDRDELGQPWNKPSYMQPWVSKWRSPRGGSQSGIASWYGAGGMTAASVTLPMGSMARVTRDDGRSVVVRIADRGPFVRGRIIDLSRSAAGALGIIGSGVGHVRVDPL